ncbi:class I SAM-dependent methyltransferase [Craterilacuibacter sinensis]|uniref:Methyltransferase domain-containing protein n=1 Tax=Craterilacuibacter sinensis TaxID=2686017 RepID=A0A845BNS3_9NEIS|nr:class I SAM-dependent methyltransferase [Craterilacuibacter sinensis]MXR37050.1 methyltransferase domain-containing protein [Craterilacuibacter sinensis]
MTHAATISFSEPERLSLIFDAPDRQEWQNTSRILEVLELRSDMIVADVGAGTGYFTALLAERLPQGHVYAIDPEPNMVRHMQTRFADSKMGAITVSQSLLTDPCLPSYCDLVFLANVYRFIHDRPLFLTHLYQQILTQTRVVFVDFKGSNARVSPAQAVAEVVAAGFTVRELDESSCPDHYIMHFYKSATDELQQNAR